MKINFETPNNGWNESTEQFLNTTIYFLEQTKPMFVGSAEERKKQYSTIDFQVTGPTPWGKTPVEILSFSNNEGKVDKIKMTLSPDEHGQKTEIFITGKALEDFLTIHQNKQEEMLN